MASADPSHQATQACATDEHTPQTITEGESVTVPTDTEPSHVTDNQPMKAAGDPEVTSAVDSKRSSDDEAAAEGQADEDSTQGLHANRSKRSRRLRRRGRLHKRQLNDSDQGEEENDAETAKQIKKAKSEEAEESNVYKETDYYFENGLRKVYPYTYTYLCHCKLRWKGQTVLDVLSNEFIVATPEVHAAQIERGMVRVNGKVCQPNRVLQGKNELISNRTHRHELPVTAEPIKIVADTDDYLVINKPSSIPVHPCGRYRHNSITFILGREHNGENLRPIYRLDRLTSGLLIFGKNHAATRRLMDQIQARQVSKTYLCRTVGKFPDGIVECKEPLAKLSEKIGSWRVKEGGKPSHTTFERVSFNGDSSVVKCTPHTGRTHQIRVHLQYLGHPIINDPLYNSDVWGPERGKGGNYGKSEEQLYEDMIARNCKDFYETGVTERAAAPDKGAEDLSELSNHDLRLTPDPYCDVCQKNYADPKPEQLVIYLHALSYKGQGWEFSTEEPEWAHENWSADPTS